MMVLLGRVVLMSPKCRDQGGMSRYIRLQPNPEGAGMLTLTFSAYDLTSITFAFSPLREVSASIHALRTPSRRALHLPWFKQVGPNLGSDLAPLLDLIPGGEYIPDFLMPVPTTSTPELAAELAALRSIPDEVVRADLDRMTSWPSSGPLTGMAVRL